MKDFLYSEKFGTGKLHSILDKGVREWKTGLWEILQRIPSLLVMLFSAYYLLSKIGSGYFFIFLCIAMLSVSGYVYFRLKQMIYKKSVSKLDNEKNKHSIKSIMSRTEVVYANKVNFEKEQIV